MLMLHMGFGPLWTTILAGAAAVLPALATRLRRYPVLGWLAAGAAIIVIGRVAFDPTIVGPAFLGMAPVFNALLPGYGIPALAGKVGHNIDIARLEEEVAKAIHRFEPRLSAASLEVRALLDPETMRHNTLAFEIEAELWALPVPLRLRLRTQIDLESGAARVLEQAA